MARWKATDAYVPNLTFKSFLHMDHPKVKGGSDITDDVGSASTPGKSVF